MEQSRDAYGVLVEKPEGKRPLGRPRRKWKDNNIKLHLQEAEWGTQTGLIWLRIGSGGGLFLHRNEPSDSIKFGKFID
jgi:hypothetical protein